MYQLRLVQAADGLGQRVVVAVAFAAARGLDAGFDQALAVANGHVFRCRDVLTLAGARLRGITLDVMAAHCDSYWLPAC